jgi:hypothetical protein
MTDEIRERVANVVARAIAYGREDSYSAKKDAPAVREITNDILGLLSAPEPAETDALIQEASDFNRGYLRDGIPSDTLITDHIAKAHRLIKLLVVALRAASPTSEPEEDVDDWVNERLQGFGPGTDKEESE